MNKAQHTTTNIVHAAVGGIKKRISKFEIYEIKENYRINCGTHHIQTVRLSKNPQQLTQDC